MLVITPEIYSYSGLTLCSEVTVDIVEDPWRGYWSIVKGYLSGAETPTKRQLISVPLLNVYFQLSTKKTVIERL